MSEELAKIRAHLAHHDARLDELESRAANEAGLRAMMDQDLATVKTKLDANTRLLEAVATTQGEHSRMLTRLETDVAELKAGQAELTVGQAELRAGHLVLVDKLDELLRR
jgi:chromosome segregation ATPase